MHHLAHLWEPNTGLVKKFHVECSCHSAGDFHTEGEARSWISAHFQRQGGIDTSELIVGDPKPKSKSVVVPKAGVPAPAKVVPFASRPFIPLKNKIAAPLPPPKVAAAPPHTAKVAAPSPAKTAHGRPFIPLKKKGA